MRFTDLIIKKRDGHALTTEEINFWIKSYVQDEVPDYQVSALLMAIVFRGMDERETSDLTLAMMHSGDVIDLSDIEGIKVDKHSTGGVGDKTSMALMPMVAACGAKAAKMSGRGLGHTGGTLDKLESIEGFNCYLGKEDFIRQVNDIGLAIIGQTGNLVPADKKLYALRDVTGTVDSVPLIASSIMSKKLAAGSDAIMLDVKYGSGAFMKTKEDAVLLAKEMIKIGRALGRDVRAMITDMDMPLGRAIGNALEVKEAIATLKGKGPKDFTHLCMEGGTRMLIQAKIAVNEEEAREKLKEVIRNGAAFEKFKAMVRAQHGNTEQIDHPELLPKADTVTEMPCPEDGYIYRMDALGLGRLAMEIGAGRETKDDVIDPAAGIVLNFRKGDRVSQGETLARIHHNRPLTKAWRERFMGCIEICGSKPEEEPLIYKILQEASE